MPALEQRVGERGTYESGDAGNEIVGHFVCERVGREPARTTSFAETEGIGKANSVVYFPGSRGEAKQWLEACLL